MQTEERWANPDYQRIRSVSYQDGELLVVFRDGSRARLQAERVLPPATTAPAWSELGFDDYEIHVPTETGTIDVPWSTIRVLSDDQYSAFMAAEADKQARRIGERIKELRKGRSLSSKELARRAGLTPQSLSRIENGKHDVVFTTLRRILAAMGCSLRDLAGEPSRPIRPILPRLAAAGIDRGLLETRFVTRNATVESDVALGSRLERVFGWSPDTLWGNAPLEIGREAMQGVQLKAQGKTRVKRAQAYTVYARWLSNTIAKAMRPSARRPLPERANIVRSELVQQGKELTLEALIRYTWNHGIPVLPLNDSGAFHAACWRTKNGFAIVLKQTNESHARWLFDLAHELGHITQHLSAPSRVGVVETDEPSPFELTEEEKEASDFATAVLLAGREEELAQACVTAAQGKLQNLKSAVLKIAARASVRADLLANYLAFRLDLDDQDWWGTANNLQVTSPSPVGIARKILLEHCDLSRLDSDERVLVELSLSD